ncbi:hypothetical protein [Paraburkholderia tropica]|uniref:hypothetical protein n=1 Tax=Paraburkholderia tropica TaxID=92647 RepID=UPI002AB78083|nr:hypothetical protein [Paraburkholderia tropica]
MNTEEFQKLLQEHQPAFTVAEAKPYFDRYEPVERMRILRALSGPAAPPDIRAFVLELIQTYSADSSGQE